MKLTTKILKELVTEVINENENMRQILIDVYDHLDFLIKTYKNMNGVKINNLDFVRDNTKNIIRNFIAKYGDDYVLNIKRLQLKGLKIPSKLGDVIVLAIFTYKTDMTTYSFDKISDLINNYLH